MTNHTFSVSGETDMGDVEFFQSVRDPRGYLDHLGGSEWQWRQLLRRQLYADRAGRSDISKKPLLDSFECHEGLYSRAHVPKSAWQHLLFSGPNCFLLTNEEHQPAPPRPEVLYWISVAHYGVEVVNRWLSSLPWKSRPATPWVGTYGCEIVDRIRDHYDVDKSWFKWYQQVKSRLDCEA